MDMMLEILLHGMGLLQWHDYLALIAAAAFLNIWLRFYVIPVKESGFDQFFISPQATAGLLGESTVSEPAETRNIASKFTNSNLDVIILWGSQSGQSERLAKSLAQECRVRFGIKVNAESLDQYDPQTMELLAPSQIVGLILSTYGEGDPTDNAADFEQYLSSMTTGKERRLKDFRYFAFGLGSTKYQFYNKFVDTAANCLSKAGAVRLGPVGKRDEASGSDHSWMEWKDTILMQLASKLAKTEIKLEELQNKPGIQIVEIESSRPDIPQTPNLSITRGVVAAFGESKCLSSSSEPPCDNRRYLHVELDIKGTSLDYQAGDHVSIWPMNTDDEVKRLSRQFGWDDAILHRKIQLKYSDNCENVALLPTNPTTRQALLQYHMDICALPSQSVLGLLMPFTPSEYGKERLKQLLKDESAWRSNVIENFSTLASVMELICPNENETWPTSAFLTLLEMGPTVRPRNFSIASSPMVSKESLAVTVGVVETPLQNQKTFYGLTSNYLYHLHISRSIALPQHKNRPSYTVSGGGPGIADRISLDIKRSIFKLPKDSKQPIIMIAAGSGIAPFRAFMQERSALKHQGADVGKSILFFGCRSPATDFLYRDEWSALENENWFEMYTAFSRAFGKRYVQDELREHSDTLCQLLTQHNASIYICGSVQMAQGVKDVMASIVEKALHKQNGHEFLGLLKSDKKLLEDVWA